MDFVLSFTFDILKDMDKGRLAENLIFLVVLWWKVKPHLTKIEERMAGIEKGMMNFKSTVDSALNAGDVRFQKIESRLDFLECLDDDETQNKTNPQEGNHGKTV